MKSSSLLVERLHWELWDTGCHFWIHFDQSCSYCCTIGACFLSFWTGNWIAHVDLRQSEQACMLFPSL